MLIVVPLCVNATLSAVKGEKIIHRSFFFFLFSRDGFLCWVGVGRPRPALRGIVFGETNAQVFVKPAGLPVLSVNRPLANNIVHKHNL